MDNFQESKQIEDLNFLSKKGSHNLTYNNGHIKFSLTELVEKAINHLLKVIQKNGLTKEVPPDLETLHKYVDYDNQLERKGKIKKATEIMDTIDTEFQNYYIRILKEIRKIIGIDFLFPTYPAIRFHFPVPTHKNFISNDGRSLWFHNDTMICNPFENINCWIALTDCQKTNSLYLAAKSESLEILKYFCKNFQMDEDEFYTSRFKFKEFLEEDKSFYDLVYKHCKSLTFKRGDAVLFDPICIHGPVENNEKNTRVSLDFRIFTKEDFEIIKKYKNKEVRDRLVSVKNDTYPTTIDETII